MKKHKKPIQNLSWVVFIEEGISPKTRNQYPFMKDRHYLFLGEIANMPSHCVLFDPIINWTYTGYHTDNF